MRLQPWKPATLLKRDSNSCFPVNNAKFLRLAFYIEHLWWLLLQIPAMNSSCSEKLVFQKIASLIDNLKALLWKGTVPHNNYSGTNSKNLWVIPLNSFIPDRVALAAGWRTTYKLRCRDLLLLTCFVYINIYVASFFHSFVYNFFIDVCFSSEETKLT